VLPHSPISEESEFTLRSAEEIFFPSQYKQVCHPLHWYTIYSTACIYIRKYLVRCR